MSWDDKEAEEKNEVGDNILDDARKALRKHKSKKTRAGRRIHFYWKPLLMVALLLCVLTPLVVNKSQGFRYDIYYKDILTGAVTDFNLLEKRESDSITQINQKRKVDLYWLSNAEKKDSYSYYLEDKRIIIEENYIFDNVSCSIYILQSKTKLQNFEISSYTFIDGTIEYKGSSIDYTLDETYYLLFRNYYDYYLKIETSDIAIVEALISNLTTN